MNRRIETDDLVGVAEIAVRAEVSPQAVVNWQYRHSGFPKPLASLECGPVFYWPEIDKWLKATGRST